MKTPILEESYLFKLPPAEVPPLKMFVGVAFYVGPGCVEKGGRWVVICKDASSLEEAEKQLGKLGPAYLHRRIFALKDSGTPNSGRLAGAEEKETI